MPTNTGLMAVQLWLPGGCLTLVLGDLEARQLLIDYKAFLTTGGPISHPNGSKQVGGVTVDGMEWVADLKDLTALTLMAVEPNRQGGYHKAGAPDPSTQQEQAPQQPYRQMGVGGGWQGSGPRF